MQAEVFEHTWLAMDFPFPCEIHTYAPRPFVSPDAKKVLVICTEPRAGMIGNEWVIDNHKSFDLIIAYDRALAHLPNVRFLEFGGTYCHETPKRKDLSFSFLFSTGANLDHYDGYKIRRDIAANFGGVTIPGKIFLSSRRLSVSEEARAAITGNAASRNYEVLTAGEEKLPVMESMFHIAIENHDDAYFFTEKLIDCFRTYTVPIYWGTDKVLEIFDPEGMIFLDDPSRLPEILATLTKDDYWKRLPAMINNFKISENYLNVGKGIHRLIMENLS